MTDPGAVANGGSDDDREGHFPGVTVTLLVHRPGPLELQTVEAVGRQRYPGEVTLLVIDSSGDPTEPDNLLIQAAADIWEAIPPADFGHGATRNRALDLCASEVIVFLSQDACPASDSWLESLVAPLASGDADASYGRQRPRSANRERDATYGFLYPDTPSIKTKADISKFGLKTFHFSNVSSAFVASTLRKVRFPEDIPTFEDIGAAKRLLDTGARIAYVPDAEVLHSHDMGLPEMVRRYREIGRIYEKLGIFADLKQAQSSVAEGVRVARAVAPSSGGLVSQGRRAVVLAIKAGSVAVGRVESKLKSRRGPRA